ncbi:MAG: putative major pilin subunit [Phycisphaerales bacterium]|jgi:prepilin-type N-terminal cleavage/methylation domain-containing protein/prepilin-type processing-associated H-X9-DG protein|nr:putative major pilin subunit [Phycisphaerales bacterium]MDB5300383.1 putative major pilin subunit [Phycisphaerales bacterium]MDB5303276.1 putative major pilin subunit [Phycisphaerales bacterium]
MAAKAKAFSLVELLVVLGIIAALMAILLPLLEKGREKANEAKCMSNLRTIGQSIALYANENHGHYPRTTYTPGATPTAGTNPAAADPFGPGGPAANDVSAALFLLVRTQKLPMETFTCPYNDVTTWEPDPATAPGSRSNFTNFRKNLAYSYANPYPDTAVAEGGYDLSSHMTAAFPIAADINPGTGGTENSTNHEERGQNVLYADGHVSWEHGPLVGINGDNIYTARNGAVAASPADVSDAVLLPAKK